ncbi:MAG: tetratricopeptide repeat-containing glycosyltransferase family protein [Rhodopila sp.]|nr:tetratricopeptide repeat-containing glycosyltransferase family protein [Rhodopila sp.]
MVANRAEADEAKLRLGIDLHQQGRLGDAEKLYRDILQRNPKRSDALYLLGIIALATRKYQRAADLIGRSIQQNPHFPPAYCNRALALAQMKRHAEALANYDKAVALNPDFAEAHYNRGMLLRDLGRHTEAIASFDKAIAIRPNDAEAHNNRGNALNDIKHHAEALASLDRAIALKPDFAAAHCNRGNALTGLKRPAEALASYDRALALRPDFAEAYCNRGDALHELKRPDAALASFDWALALKPDFAEAHFGRSLTLLAMGRYEEGFREHEWRHRRSNPESIRSFARPLWLGEKDIGGKTLLIQPELFLGDMINFCRYAKLAEAKGAKVILAVQEPLRRLLTSLGPAITIIGESDQPGPFDYHCPLMSLPVAFGTTLETVPASVPYLHAETERLESWKRKLGEHGFKIGICWRGSAASVQMDRTFPLARFFDVSRLPHVRLISLQTGAGVEELAQMPGGMCVEDFAVESEDGLRPFVDTAAIMENLDLIITADTAIAHLAGALGRPAWVVLKEVPDWRWGLEGDVTPWYPTVRLFRQKTRDDWDGVFADIHAALTGMIKC